MLKKRIREYIATHTSFFCEAPTLRGEFGSLTVSDVCQSAYAVTPNIHVSEVCDKDVDFDTAVVSSETTHFFQNAHTVLRMKASEIVVFMATNKDRMNIDSVGYSFPVAYAMKGSTMTNADLRYMVNALWHEFQKRSIPILAEVYDRQWHQFITSDADGNSLTKLCWRHKWQEVSNFSKQKCLNSMIQGCAVRAKDLELVEQYHRLDDREEYSMGNIHVKAEILGTEIINGKPCIRRQLTVKSTGGGIFRTPVVQQIVTVCKHSRPDLFEKEIGYSTCHTYADTPGTPPFIHDMEIAEQDCHENTISDHTYCVNKENAVVKDNSVGDAGAKNKKMLKKKKIVGIKENEKNLLHLLDPCVVAEIFDDLEIGILDEDATSTELLGHVLLNEKCQLIPDIVKHLQYYDGRKWASTSVEELYPAILTDGQMLMKVCTVKEIGIISKVMEQHTQRCWFASGGLKGSNINKIVRRFGGEILVSEESTRRMGKIFNAQSLNALSKKVLLCDNYDVNLLRISLSTVLAREMKADWFRHCTVDNNMVIPLDESGGANVMEIFAYPEMNEENGYLLWRTFDYTHILTNMRSHILTRGCEYCRKEHFEWIVDNTTGVLSRYLMECNMDSQNAFSALKLFGQEVQLTLESNGMSESVEFMKLVKGWHMSCNERGLPADVRVKGLAEMHKFLTKNLNLWSVPFQYSG